LKYRECVRREVWLYDLLAGHPEARAAVGALLGAGEVADPRYFRGLYPVFPIAEGSQKVVAGHLDTHPFQVGAVLYLDRGNRRSIARGVDFRLARPSGDA